MLNTKFYSVFNVGEDIVLLKLLKSTIAQVYSERLNTPISCGSLPNKQTLIDLSDSYLRSNMYRVCLQLEKTALSNKDLKYIANLIISAVSWTELNERYAK